MRLLTPQPQTRARRAAWVVGVAGLALVFSLGPPSVQAAPQIALGEHRVRRAALAARIGDGFAVVFGQPLADVAIHAPHGHMVYLTGIRDPLAVLLVVGKDARALRHGATTLPAPTKKADAAGARTPTATPPDKTGRGDERARDTEPEEPEEPEGPGGPRDPDGPGQPGERGGPRGPNKPNKPNEPNKPNPEPGQGAPHRVGKRATEAIAFLAHTRESWLRFHDFRWRATSEAAALLGVSGVRPLALPKLDLAAALARLLPRDARVHCPLYRGGDDAGVRWRREKLRRRLSEMRPDITWRDLEPVMVAMRGVKSDLELATIRRAIAKTALMFREAIPAIVAGGRAERVDAALLSQMRRAGARAGYPFIVASGPNTTIPHYFENEGALRDGDLVLIDAGARVDGYTCDITRTFPVSGTFTKRQADVYEVVLRAQKAAIDAARPGATLRDVRRAAFHVVAAAGMKSGWMHDVSHHVGLHVHDPGPQKLAPGMVIAVEPGLYFRDEKFGIRIEDMVVITKDGCRVLTGSLPRSVREVEAWVARLRPVPTGAPKPVPPTESDDR